MSIVWKFATLVGVWGALMLHFGQTTGIAPRSEARDLRVYSYQFVLDEPVRSPVAACLAARAAGTSSAPCFR